MNWAHFPKFCNNFQSEKMFKLLSKKGKNDPKIKSKLYVRIYRNIENGSCSTTWVDPKTVFDPFPDPKNSPTGPQKVKKYPKIK